MGIDEIKILRFQYLAAFVSHFMFVMGEDPTICVWNYSRTSELKLLGTFMFWKGNLRGFKSPLMYKTRDYRELSEFLNLWFSEVFNVWTLSFNWMSLSLREKGLGSIWIMMWITNAPHYLFFHLSAIHLLQFVIFSFKF